MKRVFKSVIVLLGILIGFSSCNLEDMGPSVKGKYRIQEIVLTYEDGQSITFNQTTGFTADELKEYECEILFFQELHFDSSYTYDYFNYRTFENGILACGQTEYKTENGILTLIRTLQPHRAIYKHKISYKILANSMGNGGSLVLEATDQTLENFNTLSIYPRHLKRIKKAVGTYTWI